MRVLIAPQEFKGSLTAFEAADAIARGIRQTHPEWQIDLCPVADGGPGFVDTFRRAAKSDMLADPVHDPLGRPVLGRYLVLRANRTAIVEAAMANGLLNVRPEERDARAADTFGVGELLLAAGRAHPAALIVGVGGSASTDGGAGAARALGARFLDTNGSDLGPGGGPLIDLDSIVWPGMPESLCSLGISVATDVTNPLVGPNGAAHIYGPQKGASAADVEHLDRALKRYAEIVRRDIGADVATMPGGGAAGGLAAGLAAFLNARIESGFDVVAQAVGLEERLLAADLVVTGEGSFDGQSLQGKTTGRVLELGATHGKRCVVLAGLVEGVPERVDARALTSLEADGATAMRDAAALLKRLAAGIE